MDPKFTLNRNLETPHRRHRCPEGLFRVALSLAGICLLSACFCRAQTAPTGRHLQIGPAFVPDYGLQLGYVSLRSFYTREVVLNFNTSPFRSDGNVQISGGLGGSIRILGISRTIGNAAYRGFDVDVGLRFGPGLVFAFKETRSSKNQRFSLFGDVFTRLTSTLGRHTVWYLEAGLHNPSFRAGVWFPF